MAKKAGVACVRKEDAHLLNDRLQIRQGDLHHSHCMRCKEEGALQREE
jgi:hypothetical protein